MNELLTTPPHKGSIECIESWHDENGNWYRIYSDGFIEQGGVFTINVGSDSVNVELTLNKEFSNTNYHFNKGSKYNSTDRVVGWRYSCDCESRTTTKVTMAICGSVTCYWYACGW